MKYAMTSTGFEGEVMFEYDDTTGMLLNYDVANATLTPKQQLWLLRRLPRDLAEMQALLHDHPAITFQEIKQEVNFDLFWNRYDDKITSSKKRALKAWDKLTPVNQIRAFNHIRKYEMSLPPGTRKKYAETYLNAELWNN